MPGAGAATPIRLGPPRACRTWATTWGPINEPVPGGQGADGVVIGERLNVDATGVVPGKVSELVKDFERGAGTCRDRRDGGGAPRRTGLGSPPKHTRGAPEKDC